MSAEQDLLNVGQQYQSTVAVIVYGHLAETLEEAIVLLGGEEAPEYEGIKYVIDALDESIRLIANSL
jgi:hypothetical protein